LKRKKPWTRQLLMKLKKQKKQKQKQDDRLKKATNTPTPIEWATL
jgi:hypothetical protein